MLERIMNVAQETKSLVEKRKYSKEALENILHDLDDAIHTPLRIVFTGLFSSGKSSLINALLGKEILPVNLPETTQTTFIVEVTKDQDEWIQINEQRLPISDISRVNLSQFQEVRVKVYSDNLPEGTLFWDTPGLSSVYEIHEKITADALTKADAIIIVAIATQGVTNDLKEFLEVSKYYTKNLILVLSQADLLPPESHSEVLNKAMETLGPLGIKKIILASTRDKPGIEELRKYIVEELLPATREIKAESLAARLKELLDHLEKLLKELNSSLSLDLSDLDAKINELRSKRKEIENEFREKVQKIRKIVNKTINNALDELEAEAYMLADRKDIIDEILRVGAPYPFVREFRHLLSSFQERLESDLSRALSEADIEIEIDQEVKVSLPKYIDIRDWIKWLIVIILALEIGPLQGTIGNILEALLGKAGIDWLQKSLVKNALKKAVGDTMKEVWAKVEQIEQQIITDAEKKFREAIGVQLGDLEKALEELRNEKEKRVLSYEKEKKTLEEDIKRIARLKEMLPA